MELTDFRVPDDRVFFVPNVLEGLHHPEADVFYLQRFACTAIPGMVWQEKEKKNRQNSVRKDREYEE